MQMLGSGRDQGGQGYDNSASYQQPASRKQSFGNDNPEESTPDSETEKDDLPF